MSFPTKNRHTPSRRRAGRGQGPFSPTVTIVVTPSTNSMVIVFDQPVVVSGPITAAVATRTIVSQTVNSPTQVTILFSGTVATLAWSIAGFGQPVASYQGGQMQGASGTFP